MGNTQTTSPITHRTESHIVHGNNSTLDTSLIVKHRKSRKLSNEQKQQQQQQQQKQRRQIEINLMHTIRTWSILTICSIEDWQSYIGLKYNFDQTSTSSLCKGRNGQTCTQGFCYYKKGIHDLIYSKTSSLIEIKSEKAFFHWIKRLLHSSSGKISSELNGESRKMMEHFKYNHLPAMFSAFHHYNVNGLIKGNDDGAHNNLLLLSIYSEITFKTRFVLINLNSNKFLSIFGDYSGQVDTSSVYAVWSHDCTKCIVRVQLEMDVYDVSKKEGKLLNTFKIGNKSTIFSFFYTYNVQLAITSFPSDNDLSICSLDSHQNTLKCIKSHRQNLLHELSHDARDIRVSKDNSFIILTIGDSLCACNVLSNSYSEVKYLIFSSVTCHLLKSYTSRLSTCTLHMCPSNYLPRLSKCQSRLALINKKIQHDMIASPRARQRRIRIQQQQQQQHLKQFQQLQHESNYVKIIQCPNEISLKNLSRIVILRCLSGGTCAKQQKDALYKLPIPFSLKSYLQYDPYFC